MTSIFLILFVKKVYFKNNTKKATGQWPWGQIPYQGIGRDSILIGCGRAVGWSDFEK